METAVGKLFIISAPSGAGKTTLVNELLSRVPSKYGLTRFVTYTSRPPRINEVPGKDYHYISQGDFEAKIREGYFLEWSSAFDTYYGTGSSILNHIASGKSGILILDRPGAKRVIEQFPSTLIWLAVPSLEVLEERLRSRATETPEQIARRLTRAAEEIAQEEAEKLYRYTVENGQFAVAAQELERIVIAELEKSST
jgi:guanylate kinase